MVAGGQALSATSLFNINCRRRSVHFVHGVDGSVTPSDHCRAFACVGFAGAGAFMCDFTPRIWKFASFAGEKSTTKQPGWVTVSSHVTVIAAPGVSVVCGCEAASLMPQGAPFPAGCSGGSL